jgi:hypothetical protein
MAAGCNFHPQRLPHLFFAGWPPQWKCAFFTSDFRAHHIKGIHPVWRDIWETPFTPLV